MRLSPETDADFLALQRALAGRYSLEHELGRGGMGIVYLAQDVALDRRVALKVLPSDYAQRPTARERFIREARTAARLSHPNIVPIHVVDEVGDFVFFVMSFVEGETLGQRVRDHGPVPSREASRILREVAWALAYAHGQGVVHRDVKPDNILLEAGSGRALVTDFGIARIGEAWDDGSVAELAGTPEYMSPEQAGGLDVDARSDLYALGVVGHYMLSGTLPFHGVDAQATLAKQITGSAPPLATVAPEAPRSLTEAIDRCLAKAPADRFQGGEELADVLGHILQDRKEIPVPIRLFQDQIRESGGAIAVYSMMLLMMVVITFLMVVEGSEPLRDMMPGFFMAAVLSLLPPALLGVSTRRLLKAGYGHDELVRALRSDVEDRRRDVSAQAEDETALDVWAPRVGWTGGAMFMVGMLGILAPWVPTSVVELLLLAGMPLALGGAGITAIRHSTRLAVPGSRWVPFWESWIGKGIFGVAGVGLEHGCGVAGSYRPTEVAIGMAAERLFSELSAEVRERLGDVPAVLRGLESHAEAMRGRVQELDLALADVGGHEASGAWGTTDTARAADVTQRRNSVADELREARDGALKRLREVVAALERLRLELLRLHAGSGDVESLTVDLTAARGLAVEVGHLAQAHRDVNEMLGLPPLLPEQAETPQPA